MKGPLVDRLRDRARAISLGDPTLRENWMGPVINAAAARRFAESVASLARAGRLICGGARRTDGLYAKGFYCEPTFVDAVAVDHPLGQTEMFIPLAMIAEVDSLEEAIDLANGVRYGLAAGFYGAAKEVAWFFDRIPVGVAYANRPQGATTGAWPGFQPFGGWKASGSTGKNGGGLYYHPLYMREQIHTLIEQQH